MDNGRGTETLTNVLPNELLLYIFSFLTEYQLLNAGKACLRWENVVQMCFATKKRLKFWFITERHAITKLNRYGPSIETLTFQGDNTGASEIKWSEEIANRFPNLLTVKLCGIEITDDGFKYLSTKCSQLKNVTLQFCNFTDEGLRCFLQALPGIKYLEICNYDDRKTARSKSCTQDFGIEKDLLRQSDASAVFSTCRNLETLVMHRIVMAGCDSENTADYSNFCKMTDETLIELSKCVNLRHVKIWSCPLVSDRGCAALLAHCPQLQLLSVQGCKAVGNSTVESANKAVECRQNGLVLQLKISGTSVTPESYENCHHLLLLDNDNF